MRTVKTVNPKKALITGITGQDGSYLAELLLGRGYEVFGLVRRSSNDPFVRLHHLKDRLKIIYGDLRDQASLERAVRQARPDEIYNLAAQSDVGISFQCPEETKETNWLGVARLAEAVRECDYGIKIYQASTSEMFGNTPSPQDERSAFHPQSPYAKAKLQAHLDFVVGYRQRYGLYIVSGILFNHESPRRGEHFVTRKITLSLAKIKLGQQKYFTLGNLDARRDWGFAADYVEAMWLMLQQTWPPQDLVIATGESHTVREFVEAAAQALDIKVNWEGQGLEEVGRNAQEEIIVRVDPRFYRKNEVHDLCGNSTLARKVLGWKPSISFELLAGMMARHDLNLLKKQSQ